MKPPSIPLEKILALEPACLRMTVPGSCRDSAFADLKARKTALFPAEIASKIAAGVAAGARLDWPAPVCGAMHA